jgi:hypothetical protein
MILLQCIMRAYHNTMLVLGSYKQLYKEYLIKNKIALINFNFKKIRFYLKLI